MKLKLIYWRSTVFTLLSYWHATHKSKPAWTLTAAMFIIGLGTLSGSFFTSSWSSLNEMEIIYWECCPRRSSGSSWINEVRRADPTNWSLLSAARALEHKYLPFLTCKGTQKKQRNSGQDSRKEQASKLEKTFDIFNRWLLLKQSNGYRSSWT